MRKEIVSLLVLAFAALFVAVSFQPTLAGSQAKEQGKMATDQAMQTEKININTADVVVLATLKGVGPKLAQRIVDFRSKSGNFKSIEDLKLVKGIGDKLFDAIAPQITVK